MGISGVPLDKAEIIAAIWACEGLIIDACRKIGCTHQAIYEWKKKDADVQRAIDESRAVRIEKDITWDESLVQKARAAAERLIEADNDKMVTFTLERKGGWVKEEKSNVIQQIAYRIHKDING